MADYDTINRETIYDIETIRDKLLRCSKDKDNDFEQNVDTILDKYTTIITREIIDQMINDIKINNDKIGLIMEQFKTERKTRAYYHERMRKEHYECDSKLQQQLDTIISNYNTDFV